MRAGGEVEWIKSTGTPLGMMAPDIIELMAPYSEQCFELHPGDLLALFSDGVTEAHDKDDNEFGEERLAEFMRPIEMSLPRLSSARSSTARPLRRLRAAVRRHHAVHYQERCVILSWLEESMLVGHFAVAFLSESALSRDSLSVR